MNLKKGSKDDKEQKTLKTELLEEREKLQKEQKQVEANFYMINGALRFIEIKLEEIETQESKEPK